MAINIGTSPRGLPTPPAMLTPSESAGPCYCHEKILDSSGNKNTYTDLKAYLKKITKAPVLQISQFLCLKAFFKLIHFYIIL